ncbi:MAG TPA: hypothetical protein VGQ59_21280 [Cyclobacteriaceae bacterium]|nr:hypothetical protein [Cyclobacteriaceae bacterium]
MRKIKFDSLGFNEMLKSFTDYNIGFDTLSITGRIFLCKEKLPDTIINQITPNFYKRIFKDFTRKSGLVIRKINFFYTENNWKIYLIKYGTKEKYYGNVIGCFRQDVNFILKDAFEDICSSKSISKVEDSRDLLQVVLCEYYSCDAIEESFYQNVFQINENGIKVNRTLVKEPCNSMKSVNGLLQNEE